VQKLMKWRPEEQSTTSIRQTAGSLKDKQNWQILSQAIKREKKKRPKLIKLEVKGGYYKNKIKPRDTLRKILKLIFQ
jgi:hypothetical protein